MRVFASPLSFLCIFVVGAVPLSLLVAWSSRHPASAVAQMLSRGARLLFHKEHDTQHDIDDPEMDLPRSSQSGSPLRFTPPDDSFPVERRLGCGDYTCRRDLGPFEMTSDQKTRLREQNYIGYQADWFRVEMVGTHNSYNNKEDGYGCWPNQKASLTKQMEAGLRLLNFDVVSYEIDGEYTNIICHSFQNWMCGPTDRTLGAGLKDISDFLEKFKNRKEFILLVIEHNYDNDSGKARAIAKDIEDGLSGVGLFMPEDPLVNTCVFPMKNGYIFSRKYLVDRGYQVAAVINKDDSKGGCTMDSTFRKKVFKIPISNPDKGGMRAKDSYESPPNTKLYKNSKHYVIYEDRMFGCGDPDKVNNGEVRKMQEHHGYNQMGLDDALLNDERMEKLLWSWGIDQPAASADGDCAAIEGLSRDGNKEGKWYVHHCDRKFKAACRKEVDDGDVSYSKWELTPSREDFHNATEACRELGFQWRFEPPINAYENFQVQALRDPFDYSGNIWVNYQRNPSGTPEWRQTPTDLI